MFDYIVITNLDNYALRNFKRFGEKFAGDIQEPVKSKLIEAGADLKRPMKLDNVGDELRLTFEVLSHHDNSGTD